MVTRLLDLLFGIKIDVVSVEEACEQIASREVTVSLMFKPMVVELKPAPPPPPIEPVTG